MSFTLQQVVWESDLYYTLKMADTDDYPRKVCMCMSSVMICCYRCVIYCVVILR